MPRVTIRRIDAVVGPIAQMRGDLLVLPLSQGESLSPAVLAELFPGAENPVRALLASGDFKGELGEVHVAYAGSESFRRTLVVGLGEAAKATRERLRSALGAAFRRALEAYGGQVVLALPVDSPGVGVLDQVAIAAEAALLATYRFDAPKKSEGADERVIERLVLQIPSGDSAGAEAAVLRGMHRAQGTNLARDLGNTPANLMTPSDLAVKAAEVAREHGLDLTVLEREDAERLGMGAFLGVAQGSVERPKFLLLRYDCGDPAAPTVALVGKGITFDTGGISLKPAAKMDEMKYDMCGAAAVLGAMSAVRPLGIRVHVVAAIAACENMPGGRATKPGDVHRSYSGKTIEVLNTDAEGRLVLADALTYVVRNHKPIAVVDLATLTGAVIIALGHYGAAILSNDDDLWKRLEAAAESSGDRAWRLPIWEEMPEHLKSPFADLKNIADGSAGAGTIVGAAFLREFVEETPWAHVDIAGTAWWDKDRPHLPKGASGYGVRLILDWLDGYGR